MSKRIATTMAPSTKIIKINAAVLLRSPKAIDPETGLEISQPLSDEKIEEIKQLITSAVGIDEERGDKLTVAVLLLYQLLKEWKLHGMKFL